VLLHSWSPHDAEQPWGADEGGPEALADELRTAGGTVEHVSMDLADPAAPHALVDAAHAAFGRRDAVVANHARSSGQNLEQLTAALRFAESSDVVVVVELNPPGPARVSETNFANPCRSEIPRALTICHAAQLLTPM